MQWNGKSSTSSLDLTSFFSPAFKFGLESRSTRPSLSTIALTNLSQIIKELKNFGKNSLSIFLSRAISILDVRFMVEKKANRKISNMTRPFWGLNQTEAKVGSYYNCISTRYCPKILIELDMKPSHCSRVDRYPNFIALDFFHFSWLIPNGDNQNV